MKQISIALILVLFCLFACRQNTENPLVSQVMMHNYQKDELPDIRPLENLNKSYDELLEVTSEFSRVNVN